MELHDKRTIAPKTVSALMSMVMLGSGVAPASVMADADNGLQTSSSGGSSIVIQADGSGGPVPKVIADKADDSGLITDKTEISESGVGGSSSGTVHSDGIIVESLDGVETESDAKSGLSGLETEADDIKIEDVPVKSVRKAVARASASYQVVFDAGDGSFSGGGTSVTKTITGEIQNKLPDDPTKVGAKFVGWFTQVNGKGERVMELSNLGKDTTVHAYYTTGTTKEITLNMGCDYGNTYSFDDSVTKKTYKITVPVSGSYWNIGTLPKPNPDTDMAKLKFRGWYETEDFISPISDGSSVSTDIDTIYASFSRGITLRFVDMGGGGSYPEQEVFTNQSLSSQGVKLPVPSAAGLVFDGWYLQPSNFGDTPVTDGYVFEDQITYQRWQCMECDYFTLDYDAMMSHVGATNHAYTFNNESTMTTSVTLYAKYRGESVDIIFDPQGGFVQGNSYVTEYDEDTTIGDVHYKAGFGYAAGDTSANYISQCGPLPAVVKDGYAFQGWYTQPEGGELYNPLFKFTGDLTLYAHWELDYRILYFNPNGGHLPEDFEGNTMQVLHTMKPESLPEPKHSERKFLGWFTAAEGGEQVTTDTAITKDMGLYAHWGPANYEVDLKITFDANDGQCDVTEKTINKTQGLGSLPVPTREGYKFVGWFTAKQDGEQVTAFTRFEEDTTIYAIWVQGDIPVTQIMLSTDHLTVKRPSSQAQVLIDGLTATAYPSNATNPRLWWSSSNTSVVYVDGNGKLYGRNPGTATVTAHSMDGKVTATCVITVEVEEDDGGACKKVEEMHFVYPNQTVTMGESIQLDLRYGPEHSHNAIFHYHSTDPDIIQIAGDAEYWSYGGKTGTCKIICTLEDGSKSAEMTITVNSYDPMDPTKPDPGTGKDPITPQNPIRTVTFDTTGGESIPDMSVPDGEQIRLPEPTKVGYSFLGWYLANGTKITQEYIAPKADIILYAHWEEIPKPVICTVTFDPQNGMPAIRVQVTRDSQIGSFPEVTSANQKLLGWFTNSVGGTQVLSTQRIKKDVTYYAQWDFVEPKTYTLTLDPAGGQIDGQNGCKVSATYLTENANTWANVSMYKPTRQGYTFIGWADEKKRMVYDAEGQCIEGSYWSGGKYIGGENLVVYAMWTKNPIIYTLTFDARGGNFVNSQTYEAGVIANQFPTPTRAGYVFDGWYTKAVGSAHKLCVTMDQDHTLYAHWTKVNPEKQKKIVTITVETGLETTIDPYVVDEGTVVNLPDLTGQREGYDFKGWYTEPDCKGTRLLSLVASRDMTVYAGWVEKPKLKPKYQITFDYQDGGTIQVLEREVGESIDDFPNAIRPGYQFKGWFDQPEGGKRYVAWHDGDTRMFYAQWEPEDAPIVNDQYHTIHFNAMGGAIYQEWVTALEGAVVPMPSTTKEGYTFDGWYDAPTGGNRIDSIVSNQDLTLYAHWTPVTNTIQTYSLMMDHRDGENNASGTVTSMMLEEDQEVTELPEIQKVDDEFEGWYTKPVGGKQVKSVKAESDIVLYAQWESDNTPNPPQAEDPTIKPDANEHIIHFVTSTDDVSLAPIYVKDGQILASLPTPYRKGYQFEGWYTQSTGGQQVIGMVVSKTMWVYAHWTPVKPSDDNTDKPGISGSDDDGGDITGTTSNTEFKDYVKYQANRDQARISWKGLADFIKSEYNGTVTGYQVVYTGAMDGETDFGVKTVSCTLTDLDPKTSYELTLRVNYTRNSGSTASFDIPVTIPGNRSNLGSGSLDDSASDPGMRFEYTVNFDTGIEGLTVDSVTASSGVTVRLPQLAYPNKKFEGWYTAKDGGAKVESLTLSDNITLYAHWSGDDVNPDNKTYTVTFDYQDGSTRTVTENIGTALGSLPTASRDGYTFLGWFTERSGGTQVTEYSESKNTTFYAHWKTGGSGNDDPDIVDPDGPGEGQFTLTFNTQGGDLLDPVYVDADTTVDSFPTPVRDGYTFLGWYSAPTGGKAISGVVVKSDVTLYAQWKSDSGVVDSYTVTVSANGGKFSDGMALHTWTESTGSIKDPNVVLAGVIPKRMGYKFLGYSYDKTGGELLTSVIFDSSIEGRVLYAQWENPNKPDDPGDDDPGNGTVTPDLDDDNDNIKWTGSAEDAELGEYVKYKAEPTKVTIGWKGLRDYLKSEYGYTVRSYNVNTSKGNIQGTGKLDKDVTKCILSGLKVSEAYTFNFLVTCVDEDGELQYLDTDINVAGNRGGNSGNNGDDNNDPDVKDPDVTENLVKRLELNTHKLTVTRGDLINLSYTFSPKNADNAEFVWDSSDDTVISVANGSFRYVGTGVTTLTVSTKDGSISDSCEITVKPKPGTSDGSNNGSNFGGNSNNGNNNGGNSNGSNNGNNGSYNGGNGSNGSNGSGSNGGSNYNGGSNGSNNGGSTGNGSGSGSNDNKANQIVDYVLTMTSTTGSTTRVTVKSNVTLAALAGKLGYEPAAFSIRTSTQSEHRIDSNTSMYAIADLTKEGEVLVIAIDKSGKAIGGAKVTRTDDTNYKVVLTKDTSVALRSNSDLQGVNGNGKGNNPGGGNGNGSGSGGGDNNSSDGSDSGSGSGGEGARGVAQSDGTVVTNTGKSSKEASSVRTADSPVAPIFGGIFGGLVALCGLLFTRRRKK